MKLYKIKPIGLDSVSHTLVLGQSAYDEWVRMKASYTYGIYRIVGDESSGHYCIDFDMMYQVDVEE